MALPADDIWVDGSPVVKADVREWGVQVETGLITHGEKIDALEVDALAVNEQLAVMQKSPFVLITKGDAAMTGMAFAGGIYMNTVEDGPHVVNDGSHTFANIASVSIDTTGPFAGMVKILVSLPSSKNLTWYILLDDTFANSGITVGTKGAGGAGFHIIFYMPMAFNLNPYAVVATTLETASPAGVVPHAWFNSPLTPIVAYMPDAVNNPGWIRVMHPSIGNSDIGATIVQENHPIKAIVGTGSASTYTDIQMRCGLGGLLKKDGADFIYVGECAQKPTWSMDGAGLITVLYNQSVHPVGRVARNGVTAMCRSAGKIIDELTPITSPGVGFTCKIRNMSDNALVTSSTGIELVFNVPWEVNGTTKSGTGILRVQRGVAPLDAAFVVHNNASVAFGVFTPRFD